MINGVKDKLNQVIEIGDWAAHLDDNHCISSVGKVIGVTKDSYGEIYVYVELGIDPRSNTPIRKYVRPCDLILMKTKNIRR